jgi:hypothetical protein
MGDDQRFERWASGILGVVSLVLILNLARIYATRWRAASPARPAAHVAKSLTKNQHVARQAAEVRTDSHRIKPSATAIKPKNKNIRQTAPAATREARPQKIERAAASAPRREAWRAQAGEIKPDGPPDSAPTAAAPAPATTRTAAAPRVVEMQPFGYVEKADGSRQAAVSVGDRVLLVHEGETFDDHYRVLKISATAVEVADLEAPASIGDSTASPSLEANGAAGRKNVGPGRTVALQEARTKSAFAPTREPAVTGAGEDKLARDGRRLATSRAPTAELSGRHDKMSPPGDSSSQPMIPVQPVTQLTQKDEPGSQRPESLGYVEWAGRQPEAILAAGDQIQLVPDRSLVATIPMREPGEDSSWHPPPADSGRGVAGIREVADRGGGSSNLAMGPELNAQPALTFKPYCFVEKADGSREAFITLDDRAYLVFEGERFADRYRVLKISPGSVEVADDSLQQNRLPASPAVAIAENNLKSREPPRFARRSMPEALPWDEVVRSAAVLAADAALDEKREALEDSRTLKGTWSEPTLPEGRSSTLVVSAVQPRESAKGRADPPFLDSDLTGPFWKERNDGAKSDLASPEPEPRGAIKPSLPGVGSVGITPLPLNVGGTQGLFNFPPNQMGHSPSSNSNIGRLLKQSQLDLSPPQAMGHSEGQSLTQTSALVSPGGSMGSVASLQPSSGSDLHLHFSIGDNGCYVPR